MASPRHSKAAHGAHQTSAAYDAAPQTRASSFGSGTHVGRVREHNEDSLIVAAPLYVVCDGMGGHAAGEVASEIAVSTIARNAPQHPDAYALGQAVEAANLAIIQAANQGKGRAGMGTTCTAAVLENEHLVIAQVGDSRAYLLHNGRLQQITRDHSLMADLIEAGRITPEEAKTHPQRSVITRALGSDPRTEPDLYEIGVHEGDRLLLCSDGLTAMLDDAEIRNTLSRVTDPQRCASRLIDQAVDAGGVDNVTVIVVDVTGFAEARHSRIARKTKMLIGAVLACMALAVAGAAFAVNYIMNNSAYLAESDGYVAIYRGIPGEAFGISFSELEEVTDVSVADLQPGLANRLKGDGVAAGSVEDARALVSSYEIEVEARLGDKALADEEVGA
ncbi:MAG: Stp1/IreP family PP2C-type Ser/Thr phosphatase [Eggerthellaceae bacterium]|nr:Stp1/IreP family PP2C-type Ser/Thr phosphatase [Eggerthellaceae bacterium]